MKILLAKNRIVRIGISCRKFCGADFILAFVVPLQLQDSNLIAMVVNLVIFLTIYMIIGEKFICYKVFKSGLSKFCERQPLKNLLSPLLNKISHMSARI